jgi:hypothetical protein
VKVAHLLFDDGLKEFVNLDGCHPLPFCFLFQQVQSDSASVSPCRLVSKVRKAISWQAAVFEKETATQISSVPPDYSQVSCCRPGLMSIGCWLLYLAYASEKRGLFKFNDEMSRFWLAKSIDTSL